MHLRDLCRAVVEDTKSISDLVPQKTPPGFTLMTDDCTSEERWNRRYEFTAIDGSPRILDARIETKNPETSFLDGRPRAHFYTQYLKNVSDNPSAPETLWSTSYFEDKHGMGHEVFCIMFDMILSYCEAYGFQPKDFVNTGNTPVKGRAYQIMFKKAQRYWVSTHAA